MRRWARSARSAGAIASGGQRVNHLDEDYGGRKPDILDSAYVIVEYPSGARASLDLCMFAETAQAVRGFDVTGAYFAAAGVVTFYPRVVITFCTTDADEHCHVPLLLNATTGGEPAYDGPFYAQRSPINVVSKVKVPTFLVAGPPRSGGSPPSSPGPTPTPRSTAPPSFARCSRYSASKLIGCSSSCGKPAFWTKSATASRANGNSRPGQ